MVAKILITNPIHDDVYQRLAAVAEVEMNTSNAPWPYEEVCRRATNATAMMGFMTDTVDDEFLRQAPQLKIVACALKGYDSYDITACTKAGVWLSIVPDLLTEPTAELALALALSLARHVRAGDDYVRRGGHQSWRPHFYGTGLKGATIAVLGLGQVGSAIATRLQGFECARIVGVDAARKLPGIEASELNSALQAAEFVFLALPLTQSTWHLLDSDRLAQCKPGQLIINVGRGSVVNELAIADALATGRIGGYAADVFSCEDWAYPARLPVIPEALLRAHNTLFTPHLGSAVHQVRRAIEHRAADNIIAVLEGRSPRDAIAGPQLLVSVG